MKKLLLFALISLTGLGLLSCGITTVNLTLTYHIDDIASTDDAVEVYTLDLNSDSDYEEHKDNIKSVDQIGVVAWLYNNLPSEATAEIWVATDDSYTTAEEVRDHGTRVFVLPEPIPASDSVLISWENGLTYMENTDYLTDLIINEGTFAVYGIAAETPFDVKVVSEIVISLTVGL